jgi:hypothetical protein
MIEVTESDDEMRSAFAELQRRMSAFTLPSHDLSDQERWQLRYELDVLEASIEYLEHWSTTSSGAQPWAHVGE